MDTRKLRKENLQALADRYGGATNLAVKLGQSKSWISQLIGRNSSRQLGDSAARNIEKILGLSVGWLDSTHRKSSINNDLLIDSLELVLGSIKEAGVTLHIAPPRV